jgi:transposase-like protein
LEVSQEALRQLLERRFEGQDILVVYLDGLIFGEHHVIAAIGVDHQGGKHVLGLVEGASENAAACKALLEDLVARGVKPGRRRLFVIDGSKALRAAIDAVYGKDNPVQRCRSHKIRNVLDQLPKDQRDQARSTMRAAYRLEPAEGKARLEQLARWYEKDWPQAAASLREGLAETFTVNGMGLAAALRRCLCTTNLIESPGSGVRLRTRRVCRWRDGTMVLRWAATAMQATEKPGRGRRFRPEGTGSAAGDIPARQALCHIRGGEPASRFRSGQPSCQKYSAAPGKSTRPIQSRAYSPLRTHRRKVDQGQSFGRATRPCFTGFRWM